VKRLVRRHDAELLAFFVDNPDLGDTDHLVDAQVPTDDVIPS